MHENNTKLIKIKTKEAIENDNEGKHHKNNISVEDENNLEKCDFTLKKIESIKNHDKEHQINPNYCEYCEYKTGKKMT